MTLLQDKEKAEIGNYCAILATDPDYTFMDIPIYPSPDDIIKYSPTDTTPVFTIIRTKLFERVWFRYEFDLYKKAHKVWRRIK